MFRKHRKIIVEFILYILLWALIGVGLYLLVRANSVVNAYVIMALAAIGVAQVATWMCRGIDVILDRIFKDDEDSDGIIDCDEDDEEEISILVWCKNNFDRTLLMHEYIARLSSYDINIEYMLVKNFVIFATDKVRVEFAVFNDDICYGLYYDKYFDCCDEFDEDLLNYILEVHGIAEEKEEDVNDSMVN